MIAVHWFDILKYINMYLWMPFEYNNIPSMQWISVNVLMFTLYYMNLHFHWPCIGRAAMGFGSFVMFLFLYLISNNRHVSNGDNKPCSGRDVQRSMTFLKDFYKDQYCIARFWIKWRFFFYLKSFVTHFLSLITTLMRWRYIHIILFLSRKAREKKKRLKT